MEFPTLTSDGLKLSARQVPTESGNPFHNVATGKFAFAPPGVSFIEGGNLLKVIDANARKTLGVRAQRVKANQAAIKIVNGQTIVVLLRDGRLLDSFSVAATQTKGTNIKIGDDPDEKAFILDAARDLNLEGDKLRKWLEGKFHREITDEEFLELERIINSQRIEDLIQYLHTNLRRKLKGESENNMVRIRTPRGFIRRSFSRLEEKDARYVVDRLQLRGWSEKEIQENVISAMPKRLRDILLKPFQTDNPDD